MTHEDGKIANYPPNAQQRFAPLNAESQGRCAKWKKNNVRKCLDCGVRLHIMYFFDYHK